MRVQNIRHARPKHQAYAPNNKNVGVIRVIEKEGSKKMLMLDDKRFIIATWEVSYIV